MRSRWFGSSVARPGGGRRKDSSPDDSELQWVEASNGWRTRCVLTNRWTVRVQWLALVPSLLTCASMVCAQQPANPESSFTIVAERKAGTDWAPFDPSTAVLPNGTEIRFHLKAEFRARVHMLVNSSGGRSESLFPSPETGLQNRLAPSLTVVVPSTEGAFRIDGPPGEDVLYWVVTPETTAALTGHYVPLPPPPPLHAGSRPRTLIPRCDNASLLISSRRTGDGCLAMRQDVQPGPEVPENRIGDGQLRSRDIRFFQDPAKNPESVRLQQPFIYEMRIRHQ